MNEGPAAGDRPAAVLPVTGKCNRCSAPLAWVKTVYGRNLPLNPEPSRSPNQGNFGLCQDGVAIFVRDCARRAAFSEDGTSEFPIYVAHFATCPKRR